MPHEDKSAGHGVSLRQASDGALIFNHPKADTDVGRACAAELDKSVPGFKFWASSGMGLYDLAGNVVGSLPNNGNNTTVINHIIWWDGEVSRDLLDGNQITKWSVANNSGQRLLTATGFGSVNGTKSNPVLQADLFGDWREEVIFSNGTNAIRIYTTMMPTTHRLVTLMHDPVYRVAVSWQNSSYNQPPHPGYYIASDMNFPPPAFDVAAVGGDDDIEPPPTTSVLDHQARPASYSLKVFRAEKGGAFRVSYSIKEGGVVRVDLYDIKGVRVRTLVNASRAPGAYQDRFSADGLAAGMYFVKLNEGRETLREKFLVVK
jgi:rhamnogalacturonan endolyase